MSRSSPFNPGHNPRPTTQLGWRQTIRAFARYWLAERRSVAIILALLLAVIAAEAIAPAAFGELVGAVSRTGMGGDDADIWSALAVAGGAMIAAILLRQLLDRLWNGLTARSMQRLQLDLFARVQRLPANWHANSFAGATVHRISRARWALDMLSNIIILRLLQPLLLLVVIGTILCWRYPLSGIAFLAGSMFYLVTSWILSMGWVRPLSMQSAARDSQLTGALADSIGNNATVKAFAAEAREDERLRVMSDVWLKPATGSFNRATDTNAIQMLLWTVTQMSVFALIASQSSQGRADVTDIAFAMSAIALLSGSLKSLGQDIRTIQRAYAELEDAAEFLVATDAPAAAAVLAAPVKVEGHIRFDGVGFAYLSGLPVFEGLSFTVAAGQHVALVGPSGAGKSTVAKLIQRLYEVQTGRILIDGQDIARLPLEALRGMISSVPQEPILFHRSLADNIRYARPDASMDEVIAAARKARADIFIDRFEKGYDTIVGERGAKLSGGERQRIAIARALLADRPILLLDEATSSLDTETERLVQQAIGELVQGRTTLIIAHRLSTIRDADHILVFGAGGLVEQGTHNGLIARAGGQYRRLFELSNGQAEPALGLTVKAKAG